jgi:hypothetical protein
VYCGDIAKFDPNKQTNKQTNKRQVRPDPVLKKSNFMEFLTGLTSKPVFKLKEPKMAYTGCI